MDFVQDLEQVIRTNVIILREKKGWTQDELAIQLGKSRSYVALLESGQRGIKTEHLKLLGEVFNVTPDYFLKPLSTTKGEDIYFSENPASPKQISKLVGGDTVGSLLDTEITQRVNLLVERLNYLSKQHRINSLLHHDNGETEKESYQFGRSMGIDCALQELEAFEYRCLHFSHNPRTLLDSIIDEIKTDFQYYRTASNEHNKEKNKTEKGLNYALGYSDSLNTILEMMEEIGLKQ